MDKKNFGSVFFSGLQIWYKKVDARINELSGQIKEITQGTDYREILSKKREEQRDLLLRIEKQMEKELKRIEKKYYGKNS